MPPKSKRKTEKINIESPNKGRNRRDGSEDTSVLLRRLNTHSDGEGADIPTRKNISSSTGLPLSKKSRTNEQEVVVRNDSSLETNETGSLSSVREAALDVTHLAPAADIPVLEAIDEVVPPDSYEP